MVVTIAMAATVSVGVSVETIKCRRCGRVIADWDGERITVSYTRSGGVPVYIEIPARRAVIRCHHSIQREGRWTPCGEINRVVIAQDHA